MPEAQCVRYPMRPGRREAVVDWVSRLEDRFSAVAESVATVGLLAGAVFLERSDHGDTC